MDEYLIQNQRKKKFGSGCHKVKGGKCKPKDY